MNLAKRVALRALCLVIAALLWASPGKALNPCGCPPLIGCTLQGCHFQIINGQVWSYCYYYCP